jgi:hypothetical protein
MTNNALFREMVNFYNSHAYTHEYIFGINFQGNIYMVKTTSEMLAYVLKLDKASRGAGMQLRFKPNNSIRAALLAEGAELICSAEMFKELVAESKYNKGEIFEKLVTEYFGQTWEKDSVPFTDDGDLTVDGIAYQIKFESASFINEKQMMRMRG